ncbi:MAG: bifunctional diguanylate cyclase/phosphodiesterase [Enterobacterales bacterium]|nr:bifunctional diguanylate cyclase/phosphodiesterase [Enterobacterales bacterium]
MRQLLASVTRMGLDAKPVINELKLKIQQQIALSNQHSNKQLSTMSFLVLAFSLVVLIVALLVGYYVVKMIRTNYEKRRMALFIEKSPIAIASISLQGELEFVNIAWRKEYPKLETSDFYQTIKQRLSEFRSSKSHFCQWNLSDSGNDLQIAFHKVANLDQVMVYIENISERVQAQRELEYIAYNDPLTGLANTKKLELDIEEQISKDLDAPFYVLTVGMKRLKLVSTTHGYSVSDALIKALVLRLKTALSPLHDTFKVCRLYRFTGAKLCVLLANTEASPIPPSILEQINGYLMNAMDSPLQTLYGNFFLDFQTGCVTHPEHGLSASLLLKNANAALAEAQKRNNNRLTVFDKSISENEQKRYQLENDLRAADFDREFFVVYQSKIGLQTSNMNSMEALVRWNHPVHGLVSPIEFISIAETSGVILSLGKWVLRKAIEQTKQWHGQGLSDLQVAVNVSPSQLLSADFLQEVTSALADFKFDAKFLEIEITEEVLVSDQVGCVEVLNQIRALGISVAVDDFGTGYSSLGYLNKFPLSKLKIDRSFVTAIDTDKNNYAIVEAIIALSKSLGMKVIAEGIETEAELKVLKDLACDIGQGYLFSKPLTVEDFSKYYLS